MFWTLAAFSFFWRAAQSEAERPSGTYLCFERWCAGARSRPARRRRARAATPNDAHLFWEYLVQLRAARPPAARDSQPEMLFRAIPSSTWRTARGAPARGTAAPRRASAPGQISGADAARAPIHGHGRPGDAARREGRGAAGKGEDDRGLHTANLPPAIFVEQEPRRYEHKPLKGRASACALSHHMTRF